MLTTIIKNGMYIHVIHAALTYTYNFYLASCISIKLYSINYFYWYGHLLNYLKNPRLNWVKQFIRFTDTGHIIPSVDSIITQRAFYYNGWILAGEICI